MSSGLTAAKCPSCKIILLRPLYSNATSGSSRAISAMSSSQSAIMHCPACSNRYSLRKGAIIPAILLTSAVVSRSEALGDASSMITPTAHCCRHAAGWASDTEQISPRSLGQSNLRSPRHRVCRPPNPPPFSSPSSSRDTSFLRHA